MVSVSVSFPDRTNQQNYYYYNVYTLILSLLWHTSSLAFFWYKSDLIVTTQTVMNGNHTKQSGGRTKSNPEPTQYHLKENKSS